MVSRADRSAFAEWWWTVDRLLVAALVALLVGGVVLSFAASPPVAERYGLDTYHFVKRQVFFAGPALLVLFATSFLTPREVRRVAVIVFGLGLLLLVLTLFVGGEVKGSRRWISIGIFSIQPSEIVKPAFVILAAWLFSENMQRKDVPGNLLAVGLLVAFVAPMVLQPDFGQTLLVAAVWGMMFFMAGLSWPWIATFAGIAASGLVLAYLRYPHFADRIDRFLDPAGSDTYQVDRAIKSFIDGGWLGKGPGEGTVKRGLPDSHTDFIFAVAGEEFGILICLVILAVFAFIVFRGLAHARGQDDAFIRLAIAGLVGLFGVQAAINMAVNVQLLPAKGMTLPFISYGGSSLISVALGMGFLVALTRRRLWAGGQRRRLSGHRMVAGEGA